MARAKIDGVIEAVRYTPHGEIAVARTYERRGVVWSDHVLLEREELVERLKKGKRFVTGERKVHLGSVFETGQAVRYVNKCIVTDGQAAARDQLAGVSTF
ncbi:MAG: hypothetical protein ABIF04_04160 [Chloroflexota bacterium]